VATGIEGDNHALACGVVTGALMKGLTGSNYSVEPVMDGSDYTKALILTGPSGTKFVIEVTPQGGY